jgi:hypothetical protein
VFICFHIGFVFFVRFSIYPPPLPQTKKTKYNKRHAKITIIYIYIYIFILVLIFFLFSGRSVGRSVAGRSPVGRSVGRRSVAGRSVGRSPVGRSVGSVGISIMRDAC